MDRPTLNSIALLYPFLSPYKYCYLRVKEPLIKQNNTQNTLKFS